MSTTRNPSSNSSIMASMGEKTCSIKSSEPSLGMIVQEKGGRNKRKFTADTPLADPNKVVPEALSEGTTCEFTAEKNDIMEGHGPSDGCETVGAMQEQLQGLKLDLGLSCAVGPSEVGSSVPREEVEFYEAFHDAAWNESAESMLHKLLLNSMDTHLKTAIKEIVAYGYSEEVAIDAVAKSGRCFGTEDLASNIVDSTLEYLQGGQCSDILRVSDFENIQALKYLMVEESVSSLREVDPNISIGDALWFLLVSGMNIAHACVMEADHPNSSFGDGVPDVSSVASLSLSSQTDPKILEPMNLRFMKVNPSTSCSHNSPSEAFNMSSNPDGCTFQSEAPTVASVSNLNSEVSLAVNELTPDKECPGSESAAFEKTISLAGAPHLAISEEKFMDSRKMSGISKREYIHRQKSLHLEKNSQIHGSKVGTRAGKLNGFGGLLLDKNLKPITESTDVSTRSVFKIGKEIGVEIPQDYIHDNLSANAGSPSVPALNLEADNAVSMSSKTNVESSSAESSLPAENTSPALLSADTELSLSLPANSSCVSIPVKRDAEASNISHSIVPVGKSLAHSVPEDKKDEMILKLVPRVRELQHHLQEWTEWANQKVMQAARRLSKDKGELKTLREEKHEVERLKKEKQNLEENTMKKLSEMENALCKASGQVERANAAFRRLEREKTALEKKTEEAKSRAAEAAASCEEVMKREKANTLKFQLLENKKAMHQEELTTEKHKYVQLKQKVEQAKDLRDQLEARWEQEAKAKEELLAQSSLLKKEREQIEASVKSKEDCMKTKAENNLRKHKDDIQKLEKEISQLRLKIDSSKIAALKRGIDGSYASRLADSTHTPIPRESHISYISKVLTDFEDYPGNGGVKRERECVMCLSEEMSVVFLPCGHQVVCTKCNELHQKQGMEDCPSCRSPIQKRICVRYAHS